MKSVLHQESVFMIPNLKAAEKACKTRITVKAVKSYIYLIDYRKASVSISF